MSTHTKRRLILVAVLLLSSQAAWAADAANPAASREAVYRDMRETFGLVPSFFKLVPDNTLELEWQLFKTVQMAPGPIPNKYRELIGVALSAYTHCQYCIAFHVEIARLNGATDAELEDAVHYAKSSAGWSTYLNGMQVDLEQFRKEVRQAAAFAKAQSKKSGQ